MLCLANNNECVGASRRQAVAAIVQLVCGVKTRFVANSAIFTVGCWVRTETGRH